MLAVASLAVGVVASLTAPSAHAGVVDGSLNNLGTLSSADLLGTGLGGDAPSAPAGGAGGHTAEAPHGR